MAKQVKQKKTKKKKPKTAIPVVEVPASSDKPEELTILQRNVLMFKDWINGLSHEKIADKYKLHVQSVHKIASDNNWTDLKKKTMDKMFSVAVNEVKSMAYTITLALKRDMQKIVHTAIKEDRVLSEAERAHFRTLLDRFFKEARLDEGKPTDITGGTQVHRVQLVLPPGVKRFGIIPPDPRVTYVEKTEEKKSDMMSIDDIDVGDDS